MAEARYSINLRINDMQLTVRGDSYGEFANNLDQITQDNDWSNDLGAFYKAATGNDLVSPQQAVANVQQVMPGAQVQQAPQVQPQQAPAASPTQGTAHTCEHGQRQFKTGQKKNGGTWQGWFCPVKGGCEVVWG